MEYFTSVLIDQLIEVEYKRIEKGEYLSSTSIPYTTEYLNIMIEYHEYEEEYEKCSIILKYRNDRLNHVNRFVK
jgi:hypothetical protein